MSRQMHQSLGLNFCDIQKFKVNGEAKLVM